MEIVKIYVTKIEPFLALKSISEFICSKGGATLEIGVQKRVTLFSDQQLLELTGGFK